MVEANFSYCTELPGPADIVEERPVVEPVVIRGVHLGMVAGSQCGHLVPKLTFCFIKLFYLDSLISMNNQTKIGGAIPAEPMYHYLHSGRLFTK